MLEQPERAVSHVPTRTCIHGYVALCSQWLCLDAREMMRNIEWLEARGRRAIAVQQVRWGCRTPVIKVKRCLVCKMRSGGRVYEWRQARGREFPQHVTFCVVKRTHVVVEDGSDRATNTLISAMQTARRGA